MEKKKTLTVKLVWSEVTFFLQTAQTGKLASKRSSLWKITLFLRVVDKRNEPLLIRGAAVEREEDS